MPPQKFSRECQFCTLTTKVFPLESFTIYGSSYKPKVKHIHKLRYQINVLCQYHSGYTIQLNLNFTHACRHTHVLARLMLAKLKKLAYALTVARDIGVRTQDSKHTRHESCTSRAHTWFATLHVWCNYRHSSSRQ